SAGDEIIITVMDHEANRSPWLRLRDAGVTVRTLEIDKDDFSLSLPQLDTLLNKRTRLVCFSHGSNLLGRIEPVAEITRRAHAAGARVFVDGVAYAPHRRVDVQALDVDFYVCSLYKIFGPHIGMLYGKRDILLELANINHEYLAADALPYKLQPGGASYELAWGAAGIPEYFSRWEADSGNDPFDLIANHEARLIAPLLEYLDEHPDTSLLGPASADVPTRLPIIAFRHARQRSADIAAALAEKRIAVKHGHFHSRRLLEYMDIPPEDGVVRISFAHYNSMDEAGRLMAALQEIL
ncbi:MAG TPA: aminotransferase class V-fold PLP-dependent enzyme, partial [Gammaproteobacteria bacterium]